MEETKTLPELLADSSDRDNPSGPELLALLERVQTIAVVGMSKDPSKPARRVPSYLASKGYEIIPVNPSADRILGKPARASLDEVTEPVDMVLVFRPSKEAEAIVENAMARPERPAIWLQEKILAPQQAAKAREAGMTVIQDLCSFKVHAAPSGILPGPTITAPA